MSSTTTNGAAERPGAGASLARIGPDALDARATALARIATLRLEARIPPIVEALSRKGIAAIVLKGPSTRQRLYEPEELRPTGDIDLLVAPRLQRRAARTLSRLGFHRIDSVAHADTWQAPDGTLLDLHLTIPFAGVEPSMVWRVLSLHVIPLDLPNGTISVLNVPAHFVHLAVHAVQSAQQSSARPLDELRRAVERTSAEDRAAADHIAQVLGLSHVVDVALGGLDDLGPDRERGLPVVFPRASTVTAFLRSPVSRRERARALRRSARVCWSDGSLRFWLHAQGRAMPVGRVAIWRAKVRRTVAVCWRRVVGATRR